MLTVIVVLDHEIQLTDPVKMVPQKDVVPEIVNTEDQKIVELKGKEVDHVIIVDHVIEKIVVLVIGKRVVPETSNEEVVQEIRNVVVEVNHVRDVEHVQKIVLTG